VRVSLLASGSKGNSVYVETRETRLLVDAGLSARELTARLNHIGVEAESLDAILVSHEHQDHCRGLGPMARRYSLPVHLHDATRRELPRLGKIDRILPFDSGGCFQIRDVEVNAVPLTHDAAAPVGFTLKTPEGKIGIATDLGIATRLVSDSLRDCRVLVLETNHDEEMLRDGPYPWHLKQRIRSNHGHLSNNTAAALLQDLTWDGLEAVFLAHLSETNNTPELARAAIDTMLCGQNVCQPDVTVGRQAYVSDSFVS